MVKKKQESTTDRADKEKPAQPMAKKKRYLIGHRHGPRLDQQSVKELENFVSHQEDAAIVRKTMVGRTVVEMTEDQIREFQEKNVHLVIEEDKELKLYAMPGLPNRVPSGESYTLKVEVKDATEDKPVSEVTIYAIGSGLAYKGITNDKGWAVIQVHEANIEKIIASPRDMYWSRVAPGVDVSVTQSVDISLKPLLLSGAYDWGHRLMGFDAVRQQWTGNEIKIGVIDSGITDQHPDLRPESGVNTLDGQDPEGWNVDEKSHGTHVGGIIAAINNTIGVTGAAPRTKVYSVKVFPGGYISDLVEAVEWCIRNQMDVISMSLGSEHPSQVLAGILKDAYDRGITCVAAVGNEKTQVAYPAAFPTVLGVSAIGRFGTFPEDSAHMLKVSNITDRHGILFAANFNNYGPQVDVCAPGVAILSTVPSGYAAWDGTSMACPLVSGLIALILEAYPSLRTGDSQQPEFIKSILHNCAVDLGMPPLLQGRGLPQAARALAWASYYGQPQSYGDNTQWRNAYY